MKIVSNAQICQKARQSLSGQWNFVAGATFLYLLIVCGVGSIPVFGSLASYLIAGPLGAGYFLLMLKLANSQEVRLADLFSGFYNYLTACITYILVVLFTVLWSLLLLVPGVIAFLSYSFVYLILAADPQLPAREVIATSKKLTEGYKWQIFKLYCRFVGWFLLGFLTLGLGFLWVIPYFNQALTQLYLNSKDALVAGKALDQPLEALEE